MYSALPIWLLFFFFMYSFFGWCIESTIVSVDTKKLTNRGFLRGPALPIYGFGAIIILYATMPFEGNAFLQYLSGAVACTVLEYFTGALMEAVFKTRYWDYSDHFMNYKGRICVTSSLFWGVLSLFVVHVIHEPIQNFLSAHVNTGIILVLDAVFAVVMLVDFYFSAKAAFDLSKLAGALDEINLQLELAAMDAKDALGERAAEARARVDALRVRRDETLAKAGYAVRSLVRNNPSAKNKRFAKGFDDLKEYVKKKRTA